MYIYIYIYICIYGAAIELLASKSGKPSPPPSAHAAGQPVTVVRP